MDCFHHSCSSLNTGFVRRTITKMADKMVCICWHSIVVFLLLASSKFHIGIASIKLWFKFKYGFCPANENQDGRCLSVCFCGHSTIVIYNPIASKFHIWITFIKLFPKIICVYCSMYDNQDGCTNGPCLSVCMCRYSNLVLSSNFFSFIYVWTTFIKLLFISGYGFVRLTI